jgi:long-subunit fatty acid transport protein
MYEDITYDLNWKHKFDDHWAGSAGFRLYAGDWQQPVSRNDWIYTPSLGLTYTHDKHLSAEFNYSYDWVENKVAVVPGTQTAYADGREFTRHMVSLSVKYAF